MQQRNKQTILDFATIDFYESVVVCKINTGVTLNIDEVVILHKIYRKYYGEKKFGYIFDRTNDYTINPLAYIKCPYYPDVTAFAIVTERFSTKRLIEFEENFSKRPLKTFDKLQEAMDWIMSINALEGA